MRTDKLAEAMSEHTPGPWKVSGPVTIDGYKSLIVHGILDVCEVRLEYRRESHEARGKADATLIAAAPDLLAALEEVRELIDGYMDVVDGDYGIPAPNKAIRAVQLIDAAIAKAEGRNDANH